MLAHNLKSVWQLYLIWLSTPYYSTAQIPMMSGYKSMTSTKYDLRRPSRNQATYNNKIIRQLEQFFQNYVFILFLEM